jgi:hypothetical protein
VPPPPAPFCPPPQLHRPSAAEQVVHDGAATTFGPSGMSCGASSSFTTSLGVSPTCLEATTVPKNAYITSNVWLDQGQGLHWSSPSPSNGNNGDGQ